MTDAVFRNTTSRGFTQAQFYSTASYRAQNLHGIDLSGNDLSDWDLSGQDLTGAALDHSSLASAKLMNANLTNANLLSATLAGADLTGALIEGAGLSATTSNGFIKEQLYSTTSYRSKNLHGIDLSQNDLGGWDFIGQNLVKSEFRNSDVDQTDFSRADLRDAEFIGASGNSVMDNAVLPNGDVAGLNLADDEVLVVRDYEFGINVHDEFSLAGGVVEMVLADGDWNSTVAIDEDVSPQLNGTLRIRLAGGVDAAELIGATVDLFDWNAPLDPSDRFARVELEAGAFNWNLSRLYSDGEVALSSAGLPDYNANGLVEQGDLDLVLGNWGASLMDPVGIGWYNHLPSGIVDQEELDGVLVSWGKSAVALNAAAVPEPASLGIALVLIVPVLRQIVSIRALRGRGRNADS